MTDKISCDEFQINTGLSGVEFPKNITSTYITSSCYTTATITQMREYPEWTDVMNRIENIEKRLAIVVPNKELQAKFPALQEAYDNYKLIEKLVSNGGKA